jgi:uncharacterized protein YbjQ (UPF0145 family)
MIVVTSNEIPGYRIDAVLGEVMGLTVRSRNSFANMTAGFRAIGGGELPELTKALIEGRQEVMHRMVVEAESRNANAIVAMRFDTSGIGELWTEVCAYGTAVVVTPIAEGQPGSTWQSAHFARDQAAATPPVS